MMHIGQGLVCGNKIKELIQAGFQFTIFLADWHAMINNKYNGDMDKIHTTGEYFIHCFTALGIPRNNVQYTWASELAAKSEYWSRVLKVAKVTTTNRVMRALPILGRELKTQETDAASIFYPCMQAADIFQMQVDMACAGIDQRKAHILAREAGERLGWGKPVSLHTPLLMGLGGVQDAEKASFDEDPKLSQVIAAKMSKSKPEDNILIHDTPEQIHDKIRRAYCPPRIVEGNPVLDYCRLLIFPKGELFTLERDKKYGGNLEFKKYDQLEQAYVAGKVHPEDLKKNVSRVLSDRLSPVREYFKKNPTYLQEMQKINAP